jgi:hypothetical protein
MLLGLSLLYSCTPLLSSSPVALLILRHHHTYTHHTYTHHTNYQQPPIEHSLVPLLLPLLLLLLPRARMTSRTDEGLLSYFHAKLEELDITIRERQQNNRRLEAQRNESNAKGISNVL